MVPGSSRRWCGCFASTLPRWNWVTCWHSSTEWSPTTLSRVRTMSLPLAWNKCRALLALSPNCSTSSRNINPDVYRFCSAIFLTLDIQPSLKPVKQNTAPPSSSFSSSCEILGLVCDKKQPFYCDAIQSTVLTQQVVCLSVCDVEV